MPPKKKEQEIDLATLPPCKALNIVLLCSGKVLRTRSLLDKLKKDITPLTKQEVLEHAKEKGIYVDPTTLTDKQKKDPKFMETVSTELNATVMAKSIQSWISNANIKVRMEKKAQGEQPDKPYDILYSLEQFPQSKEQFQQLGKIGENISYVLVICPKITWNSAPEPTDAEEQEDEQTKEYRNLLKKEQFTEEDKDHNAKVSTRVTEITKFRSEAHPNSSFRNTTISTIDIDIDPYAEQAALNQFPKAFHQHLHRLIEDHNEFSEWRKDKKATSIELAHEAEKAEFHSTGDTPRELLDSLVNGMYGQARAQNDQEEAIRKAIEHQGRESSDAPAASATKEVFLSENEIYSSRSEHLHYPGIKRFMMPDTPSKSALLRQSLRGDYGQFLGDLPLQQFLRRKTLLNFEEYLRESDAPHNYSLERRIYEQHHSKESLERELQSLTGEETVLTRYNQEQDKLYLMLVYRNNSRRAAKKSYESGWKVLPNFQNWLKYFKTNEGNLSNQHYYEIDYEKIGSLQEHSNAITINNAAIIHKHLTTANRTQHLLYVIHHSHVFGINHTGFYSQNNPHRLHHYPAKQKYETLLHLQDHSIRLLTNGNVISHDRSGGIRTVTPEGYSIIHGNTHGKNTSILHPNGSLTYSNQHYNNHLGYGLTQGQPTHTPTLKRTTQHYSLLKRDDQTVIVQKDGQKWVRFSEGTEYLHSETGILIQKAKHPFIICHPDFMEVIAKDVQIKLTRSQSGHFTHQIKYSNGHNIHIDRHLVTVGANQESFLLDITAKTISSSYGGDQVEVSEKGAILRRGGKQLDAFQNEEKFTPQDVPTQDYIQPRLFLINNDNTGMELLSPTMLTHYFNLNKVKQVKDVICVTTPLNHNETKHILSPQINLDVFQTAPQPQSVPSSQLITIRTFLKKPQLTNQDIKHIQFVKGEVEEWKKWIGKEENQYGYKHDPDSLQKRVNAKITSITYRKQPIKAVAFQSLIDTAIAVHQRQTREEHLEHARKIQEINLKRQEKKVDIVKTDYPWKGPLPQKRLSDQPEEQRKGFFENYFLTQEGKKALESMPDWVFKPKQNRLNEQHQEILNELNSTAQNMTKYVPKEESQREEKYDSVPPLKEILIKPSVFTQRQIDEERNAFEEEKKSYKYHEKKRKDYDLYGNERTNKPEVASLLRTQPISEINQKYLVVEAPLDKRVKISSMRNKLTSQASSLFEMRKEGPHSALMRTLDKGNDLNRLLDRRTMMVQADLNDKLQRDVLITPVEANFGPVCQHRSYELKIDIKNQDVISQRVALKRTQTIYSRVQMAQMGPIALGMTRRITVVLKASSEIIGRFTDQFEIVTKHEIYHIPITAQVIAESAWKEVKLSPGVRELELKRNKSEQLELPPIK